jgi:hypothetical protein
MSLGFRIVTALAVGLPLVLAVPGPASAEARTTEHLTRSAGPLVFDAPAGAICDFAYHQESSFTQNLERFFDGDGNLIAVHDEVALTVLHRNAETGYTLTETDRYSAHVDFVTGEATESGQTWHLVDQDGRLVLAGAGQYTIDLATGDIISETPQALAEGGRNYLCPALGGTPA